MHYFSCATPLGVPLFSSRGQRQPKCERIYNFQLLLNFTDYLTKLSGYANKPLKEEK
jgi:hypothetical protein